VAVHATGHFIKKLQAMIFEQRAFWLPKDVQDPNAYEDACGADPERGVAVVCDGVSSSLFSGRWAAILAQAVVASPPTAVDQPTLDAWLRECRETWASTIDESTLAWHQKPKMLEGAQTTILWVQLDGGPQIAPHQPYRLRIFSIGDCCLFHLRDGQMIGSFPFHQSSQFGANPKVLRSVFKRADVYAVDAMEAACEPGDVLALCSDATAAWALRQWEAGSPIDWDACWNMSVEDWQRWLIGLRQQNQIRYDDSTMLMLRVAGAPQPQPAPAARPIPVAQPGVPDPPQAQPSTPDGDLLDSAEAKLKGALKSAKGLLRKGLRDISESKWLKDRDSK